MIWDLGFEQVPDFSDGLVSSGRSALRDGGLSAADDEVIVADLGRVVLWQVAIPGKRRRRDGYVSRGYSMRCRAASASAAAAAVASSGSPPQWQWPCPEAEGKLCPSDE